MCPYNFSKKKKKAEYSRRTRVPGLVKERILLFLVHFVFRRRHKNLPPSRSCGGWRTNPRAPGKTAPALAASRCLSGWETGFCVGSSCSPPPPPPPPNRSTSVQPHKSGRNGAASSQQSHKRRRAGLKG